MIQVGELLRGLCRARKVFDPRATFLFLAGILSSTAFGSDREPGPVDLPSAPSDVAGLQEFERRLDLVQDAFFANKASSISQPLVGSVLYLDTEPTTSPLPGRSEPIACDEFLRVAADASKGWERVVERIEAIRGEIGRIRSGKDQAASSEGLRKIRELVDVASREAEAVKLTYPRDLYGVPDRIIRYVWRLKPRSILDEWGEGWTLVDDSFTPGFLSMPGYMWAGQGRLSELSTIASEPSSSGRAITIERLASPASACTGEDSVWMSGKATIRFKRVATKPQGCSGEGCIGQSPVGTLVIREGVDVVLRGETRPPEIIVDDKLTFPPPCPKRETRVDKPPVQCPH